MLQRSMARMLQPAFAGARLAPAREALRTCALQADAALAGLSREAAAVVALEAVQRCAVRASLPLYGARAGLYLLPAWLERPVWQQHPSLAPAGLAGAGCHRTADCGRAVEAALAHLAAAHEAVEEAMRGTPEPERQAVCGGVLAAAAAAVLAPHLPSGEAQDLLGLRCLEALQGSGAAAARHHVEAALQVGRHALQASMRAAGRNSLAPHLHAHPPCTHQPHTSTPLCRRWRPCRLMPIRWRRRQRWWSAARACSACPAPPLAQCSGACCGACCSLPDRLCLPCLSQQ